MTDHIAIASQIRAGKMIGYVAGETFRVSVMAFGDFSEALARKVERGELTGKLGSIPYEVFLDNSIPLYPDEIAAFRRGDDILDIEGVYERLYAYYTDGARGENMMPYGVAKAREDDPYNWIAARLDEEFNR